MLAVFLYGNATLKAAKANEGNQSAQPHALDRVCFPTPTLPLKGWGRWGVSASRLGARQLGGYFTAITAQPGKTKPFSQKAA